MGISSSGTGVGTAGAAGAAGRGAAGLPPPLEPLALGGLALDDQDRVVAWGVWARRGRPEPAGSRAAAPPSRKSPARIGRRLGDLGLTPWPRSASESAAQARAATDSFWASSTETSTRRSVSGSAGLSEVGSAN